jgi:hypothetical protein
MLRSVSAIERGAGDIRERYNELRRAALAEIDEMRKRIES